MDGSGVWTISSLLERSSNELHSGGVEDSRLNAELLLCNILRCKRIDLRGDFDRVIGPAELSGFTALMERRLSREPLQYILGDAEFMGLRFAVDKRVLIPRPETEVLVEQTLRSLRETMKEGGSVLDIGTGSGNIAVSLAKLGKKCVIDAVDISDDALEVAKLNIRLHRVADTVIPLKRDIFRIGEDYPHRPYDIIVANPPYIPSDEYARLEPEIRLHEPSIASTDNSDGLTFYREIARKGKELLAETGHLFVECAYNRSKQVSEIFGRNNYSGIEVFADYSGIKRVVKVRHG